MKDDADLAAAAPWKTRTGAASSRTPRLAAAVACLLTLYAAPAHRAAAQDAVQPPAEPAAAGASNSVGANLNISPKRVTFDRAERTATVYVFNQGSAPATFDIALIDRVMTPDGQIVAVSEAKDRPGAQPSVDRLKSAQGMLIASPRRASLDPGRGQTIRIRLAPPAPGAPAPPPGEYRTHLTVTSIPPRDIGLTAEQAAKLNPQELRFQINSVFGLSIPVILRLGPLDMRGAIEDVTYAMQTVSKDGVTPPQPTPVLTFQLVRQGSNSLFGNLEVRSTKDKADAPPLAAARGIGVYPEIDRRRVQLALSRPPAPGEQLEISFKDDDTAPGRLIAKTTVTP